MDNPAGSSKARLEAEFRKRNMNISTAPLHDFILVGRDIGIPVEEAHDVWEMFQPHGMIEAIVTMMKSPKNGKEVEWPLN